MFGRKDQNSSVWDNEINIPMFLRIRPEFQCLEELSQNSRVYENRARNPMFRRIRSQFQCLQKMGQNFNV